MNNSHEHYAAAMTLAGERRASTRREREPTASGLTATEHLLLAVYFELRYQTALIEEPNKHGQ